MSRRAARENRRRRRRRVVLAIAIPLAVIVVVLGAAATWIGVRAFAARDILLDAIPAAQAIRDDVVAGEGEAARARADALSARTEDAVALVSDPVWRAFEWTPWVGKNLTAVRVSTEVTDSLVRDVVIPATGFSLDSVKPQDGRVDIAVVVEAGEFVEDAAEHVRDGLETVRGLDPGVVDQVAEGVTRLEDQLAELDELFTGVQPVFQLMPQMLGADGPRNYLLIFQNNAEARGTGGNPASIAQLQVVDGAIDMVAQASSGTFRNSAERAPVADLDDETYALYGPNVSRFVQDITMTPDFPTTGRLASAFWAETYGWAPDGVISFDPVGLGMLLGATGPITLADGTQLTSDNAAAELLNGVYFRYRDPADQDAFFASAASTVFDALSAGSGDAKKLVDALVETVDTGHLLLWSAHEDEQAIVADFPLAGILPAGDAGESVVGLYFNDRAPWGSKMDFYLQTSAHLTVAECAADSAAGSLAVTLTNIFDPAQARTAPGYVTGGLRGEMRTDVVVYAPAGSSLGAVQVNGQSITPDYVGSHLGREVMRVLIYNRLGETQTVDVDFTGLPAGSDAWRIVGTPMVHATDRTVTADCG